MKPMPTACRPHPTNPTRQVDGAGQTADPVVAQFPDDLSLARRRLGQLGRTAEAKEALDKAVSLAPAAFDMYVRNRVPWFRPEDHAHLVEGLRKAGWEG